MVESWRWCKFWDPNHQKHGTGKVESKKTQPINHHHLVPYHFIWLLPFLFFSGLVVFSILHKLKRVLTKLIIPPCNSFFTGSLDGQHFSSSSIIYNAMSLNKTLDTTWVFTFHRLLIIWPMFGKFSAFPFTSY